MTKELSEKYQKLDPRTHVLIRPGMYIGNTKNININSYIPHEGRMKEENITYNPALLKMFDEIITNSVDEYIRGGKVNKIEVNLNQLTGEIEIKDNGGIPVEKHSKYEQYIPSMIFGELLTGSNFSDENRMGGGAHGLGSKLTSIFSQEFSVTTCDGKKKLRQTFKNNLSEKSEPKITSSTQNGTTIQFVPDYERLNCSLDGGNINRIEKRVYDVAGCNPAIKVYLNGKQIKINKFKDYVGMYVDNHVEDSNDHWEVAVASNDEDQFKHVSFVNGVDTFNGGTHVDYIVNQITVKLREYIKKKHKIDVKPNNIKQQLFVFINCKINAPIFTSQTKEFMSSDVKDFGTEFEVTDKFINKIIKLDVVQKVLDWAEAQQKQKELQALRKLEKKKKAYKSEKYLPATKKKNVLIAGEGASALGSLIPSLGRQEIGYYELKGKPLNCLNASVAKFKDNKEMADLYAILNNEGYDYFIAGTDQDLDGLSIRLLLISLILEYVPEYKGKFGFLDTPVMVAKKNGKITRWSYSLRDDFEAKPGEEIQYYKGLGTFNYEDLKYIVQQEGIENMIKLIDFSDEELYLDWLKDDRVEIRKEQLQNHTFSITNL